MTRQELIDKFVAKQKKKIIFSGVDVATTISTLTPLDLTSLTDAINLGDRNLIGSIIDTIFDKKKNKDAKAQVNALIVGDVMDLDDVAELLNGG